MTDVSPPNTIRRHVIVTGHVQGVWFRSSCEAEAKRVGVTGIVRNREDGTVEGDFEGSAEAVSALIDWCRTGPRGAVVTDIAAVDAPPIGYRDFRVI